MPQRKVFMYELILLAVYTVLILWLVPLEKIGKVQTSVREKIKKLVDKAKN